MYIRILHYLYVNEYTIDTIDVETQRKIIKFLKPTKQVNCQNKINKNALKEFKAHNFFIKSIYQVITQPDSDSRSYPGGRRVS